MREICFRGKRVDNGEWEFGQLKSIHKGGANYETAYYILDCYGETRNGLAKDAVAPDTIGQFTGLYDKNGKKIFENDEIYFLDGMSTENGFNDFNNTGFVKWSDEEARFYVTDTESVSSEDALNYCTIIGNIYDNKLGE